MKLPPKNCTTAYCNTGYCTWVKRERSFDAPCNDCPYREIRIMREEKKRLLKALSLGLRYAKMDKAARQKYGRHIRRQAVKSVDKE